MRQLIQIELNELCPRFVNQFIDEGHLPNLKRLRDSSIVMETDAEASGQNLNPWVQWVDVHTGMRHEDHGIKRLNQSKDFHGQFTWDLISEKYGAKSWICGSMNADYGAAFRGRFLPDPWSVDVSPYPPDEMEDVYSFISQSVQSHSDFEARVSYGKFLRRMAARGLRPATISKIIQQIIREKLLRRGSWGRAMLLDWLQFDLFRFYYLKERPAYATFFSNSVAHYQHHYWKDFEPEKFGKARPDDQNETSGAILDGYKNTDEIVGAICALAPSEAAVVFVTGLSQQPFTDSDRHYYHIRDEKGLRSAFEIPKNANYKPVMAQQFIIELPTVGEADDVRAKLESFRMDSADYFHVGDQSLFLISQRSNVLDVQCRCTKTVPESALIHDSRNGSKRKFYDLFYRMKETKAGVHNPIGLYWFRHPDHVAKVIEDRCHPAQVHHDVINYFEGTVASELITTASRQAVPA